MAPTQDRMTNPYGMDPDCTRCPALVETREHIVHGYGDVTGDFLFVSERPAPAADRAGVPVTEGDDRSALTRLLDACGFLPGDRDEDGNPMVENGFLTHLTRCRHPERPPTGEEIDQCDAFLTAELRTINPEILVPLGERVLERLAAEHSTGLSEDWTIESVHATEVRGRGFELVPLVAPAAMDDEQFEAAVDRFDRIRDRDYRQTKGRRRR